MFDAVSGDTELAIVDPSVLPAGFNIYEFNIDSLEVSDDRFEPVQLTYRDARTGKEATVTVIGVLAIQVNSDITAGVYVNEAAYRTTFGVPNYLRTYVKLDDGVNAKRAAESIESIRPEPISSDRDSTPTAQTVWAAPAAVSRNASRNFTSEACRWRMR